MSTALYKARGFVYKWKRLNGAGPPGPTSAPGYTIISYITL